jgi:carbon monoxide dehydrogenase subunit G
MRTAGAFTTSASPARLRELFESPAALSAVSTFRNVVRRDPATLSMTFTPVLGLGPIPFITTVVTKAQGPQRVELAVTACHGLHAVDVDLVVQLEETSRGADVAWIADVVVRGAAASVSQRVAKDLATRAVGDLLESIVRLAGVGDSATEVAR